MTYFFERFVKPTLSMYSAPRLLEVGAKDGCHSDLLLTVPNSSLTIIDPCIDMPLGTKFGTNDRVQVIEDFSLNALPLLCSEFECILLDGDHNWYTVHNELEIIDSRCLLASDGIIFFHDIDWPYARRDMYYQPELIPDEYRHPNAQKGIIRGQSQLSDSSTDNAHLFNAEQEGGERNGVLTAIEDFVKNSGGRFQLFKVLEENGLGIMARTGRGSVPAAYTAFVRKRKSDLRKAYWKQRTPGLYAFAKKLFGSRP